MTEISTNELNHVRSLSNDQISSSDDLEPHEQYFYKSLSLQLNKIQFFPKKETVLKIVNYSRFK